MMTMTVEYAPCRGAKRLPFRIVISNFEPCAFFELAEYSIGLVNNAEYVGNDLRLSVLLLAREYLATNMLASSRK
jgi:hypothetical protein